MKKSLFHGLTKRMTGEKKLWSPLGPTVYSDNDGYGDGVYNNSNNNNNNNNNFNYADENPNGDGDGDRDNQSSYVK